MACESRDLQSYLADFSGSAPIDAIVCPFTQTADGGLGLGVPLFALLVLGPLGIAMAVRIQHPGPILVAGFLTIGAFATSLPGQGAQIAAIVFFFGIVGIGFYIYQRAQTTL